MQPEPPLPVIATPPVPVIITGLAVLVLLAGGAMHLAAKWSGVRASPLLSFFTSILNFLAIILAFATFGQIGGGLIFFLLAMILNLCIIRWMFKTDWIDAIKIWLGFMTSIIIFIGVIKVVG